MTLLMVWVWYSIVGFGIFCGVFIWAVRTGQFTDLDRQRYIALNCARQVEKHRDCVPGRLDRYTIPALIFITFAVVIAVLWLALGSG